MSEKPKSKRPWSKKGVVCATRLTPEINRLLLKESRVRLVSKSAIIAEALQKYFASQSN